MELSKNTETYTLITGASRGIGKSLAEVFAQKGNNLILVARSKDDLEKVLAALTEKYNVKVFSIVIDLCAEGAAKTVFDQCAEKGFIVDTLVNNAGAACFGAFDRLDIENQMNTIKLNINSLVELTHYFIPQLKKLSSGYILNVASIVSLYPVPYFSVYAATKAFVLSFTQAVRYELRNTNIKVSCLCPGDTGTGFFDNAGLKNAKVSFMPPETVAKIAVDGLYRNKAVIFPKYVKYIAGTPKFILKRVVAAKISEYAE